MKKLYSKQYLEDFDYYESLRVNNKRAKRKRQRDRKRDKKNLKKTFTNHGHMNRHHLINKCRGGTWDYHNILWFNIERHDYWHRIFKNLDLDEVIELLIRVRSAKQNQIEPHDR